MKRFFRPIPLPAKLILTVSIPLIFVVFLFLSLNREKTAKISLLKSFVDRIHESVDITNLIDHLQSERNLSYEYILSGEKMQELSIQRIKTDSLINRVAASPYLSDFRSYTFLENLDSNRAHIDRKSQDPSQAAHYFTTIIFRLNTLNPVPPAARIYLPEVYDEVVTQKLLSEMITYLSIACTNIYTALYSRAYMLETLIGTLGTYDVFKSYEKEFQLKASPRAVKEFKELKSQPPLGSTLNYLDTLFGSFSFDSTVTAMQWRKTYSGGLDLLRVMQQKILAKVSADMNDYYNKELRSRNRTLLFLVLSFVLALAVVAYSIFIITRILTELRKDAERIARGAAAMRKQQLSNDVIGRLVNSINKVDESNKQMAIAAAAIGQGNFDVPVPVRGDEDILGNALVEMKKGLQQLTSAEKDIANLAAIVQSSHDAIVSKTLEGIVTSWNPGAEKLFGYKAEEMIGQSITKLILPENLDEEKMILEKIRRGERVEHMETIRRHKDGKLLDISLTISPIKDSKGRIIGASKIARDIAEEKKANEKMLQSELLFKTITNVSPVGLWMTDEKGRNNFVNDTWIEWTGRTQEQQHNEGWFESVIEEDREEVSQLFQAAFRNRTNFIAEFRIKRKDGITHWVLSEGSPYYDIDGYFAGYAGSVTDITDRKEDELRKNEFLAVASHELKTPLTSVKAYSQLLSQTYKETKDIFLSNALGKVDTQINKMTKLVADFLNLSKIESDKFQLQPESFDLSELAIQIVTDMQEVSFHHAIKIEDQFPAIVMADKEKIAQVLTNFLSNAIKYSPGEKNITVSLSRENGSVRLTVTDKGIGIKPEEQERIFERFYRSRFNNNISFSGFGIGLYISAEIIRRHNGTIGVESDYGKGASFYFTLPLAG